jgi:glycine cleavage system H lipoate-binding protein
MRLGKTRDDMQHVADTIEAHARDGYLPIGITHIATRDGLGAVFVVFGDVGEPEAEQATEPIEIVESDKGIAQAHTVVQNLSGDGLPVPEILPAPEEIKEYVEDGKTS